MFFCVSRISRCHNNVYIFPPASNQTHTRTLKQCHPNTLCRKSRFWNISITINDPSTTNYVDKSYTNNVCAFLSKREHSQWMGSTKWWFNRFLPFFFRRTAREITLLTDYENSLFTCSFRSDVYYFQSFIRMKIGSLSGVRVCAYVMNLVYDGICFCLNSLEKPHI